MKPQLWVKAIQTAAYLHNCTVKSVVGAIIPHEAVYGTPSDKSKMAVGALLCRIKHNTLFYYESCDFTTNPSYFKAGLHRFLIRI